MDSLIIKALKPLNIPVRKQTYIGEEKPYVTFFKMLEQGEFFADDEEKETGYYYQLSLFGPGNLNKIEKDIIELMTEAGFSRTGNWDAPYETDTKLYHKVFRFYKDR